MNANLDFTSNAAPRECKGCKGSKVTIREAFTYHDERTGEDHHYPRKVSPCHSCDGAGEFPAVNVEMILAAIKGRKGLRSKPPKPHGDVNDRRAYYVWRLARFHGGADVTMPVTATLLLHNDPFVRELDALADAVAKRVFGSDLAAAHRWGRALGHLDRDLPGLPATAYSNGPVLGPDILKPDEELPELF